MTKKEFLLYLFINIIMGVVVFATLGEWLGYVYLYLSSMIGLLMGVMQIIRWGNSNHSMNRYKLVTGVIGIISILMATITLLLIEYLIKY